MIHIVFNEPDVAVLQQAIDMDENLHGDVVQIKDDYAVGPLQNIYIGEGIENRRQWWRDVLAGGDYDGKVDSDDKDDYKTVAELVGTMRRDENETIWIWAAQNKHDVSGYYWLLNYMKEFQGRVFILYLKNIFLLQFQHGRDYNKIFIPFKNAVLQRKLALVFCKSFYL